MGHEDLLSKAERNPRNGGVGRKCRWMNLHKWDGNGINGCEEDIGAPFDMCNHDGCNHDDHEVHAPVDDVGKSSSLGTDSKRVDLCSVKPGDGQICRAEECNVKEKAKDSALGSTCTAGNQAAKGDDHRQSLACRTNDEEFSAAYPFYGPERDKREDRIDDHICSADEEGLVRGLAE